MVGADALKAELSGLSPSHLQLRHLEKFHVFKWLLDENDIAEHTQRVLSEVTASSSTRLRSKASRPEADDRDAKKHKIEMDGVMSLFG